MPFANNGDIRIHYEVEGSGPPLVLLHGAIVSLGMWYELGYVDALRGDYRLVLIDARGHGESDKPHDAARYRPEDMAGDVPAVLDTLGIGKAHFLGASMGAAIGFELARRVPHRFDALVLLGYGRYGPPTAGQQQFMARGRQLFDFAATQGGEAALALVQRPGAPQSEEIAKQFLANDWHAQRACNNAMDEWPGFEDDLPRMDVPALIIITEFDPFYAAAKQCAERMPHATFAGLPGGTHSQDDYRPDRVLPLAHPFFAGLDSK